MNAFMLGIGMEKLLVQKHGRLQDEVARHLGLLPEQDFELVDHRGAAHIEFPEKYQKLTDGEAGANASAYRDFVLSGLGAHVTATSNWAVNAAVASGYGRLWPHAYSIMPAGIYAGPQSEIRSARDLAPQQIVVGRHSGSHFAALFSLATLNGEPKLKFIDGKGNRLSYLLSEPASVGSMYGVDAYVLEAKGFRKILDTSFIVTFMIVGDPPNELVEAYFAALRTAQRAIDENPEPYKFYLRQQIPPELRPSIETEAFGIGERMVFDDYTEDMARRSLARVVSEGVLPRPWLS